MLTEKIKQRLLGLLGVCIILTAFLPVILEEPFTILKVTPTRVPEWPSLPKPQPLFTSISDSVQEMRGRIDSARSDVRQSLQAIPGKKSVANQGTAESTSRVEEPSSLTADAEIHGEDRFLGLMDLTQQAQSAYEYSRAMIKQEGAESPLQPPIASALSKEHAFGLKRAWTIALMQDVDRARLERRSKQLKQMELRSYIRTVNKDEGSIHQLFVGPQLLRRKADAALITLKARYPDETPVIVPYFPG